MKPGDTSGTVFNNWTTANLGYMTHRRPRSRSRATRSSTRSGRLLRHATCRIPLGDARATSLERDLHEWGFEAADGRRSAVRGDRARPRSGVGLDREGRDGEASVPVRLGARRRHPDHDRIGVRPGDAARNSPGPTRRSRTAATCARPHLVDQIIGGTDGSVAKKVDGHCDQDGAVHGRAAELHPWRPPQRGATAAPRRARSRDSRPRRSPWPARRGPQSGPNKQDTSWFASMVGPEPGQARLCDRDDGRAGRVRRPDRRADHPPGDRRASIRRSVTPAARAASRRIADGPRRGARVRGGAAADPPRRLVADRDHARAVGRRAAPPVLRHQPDAAPGRASIRSTA